jgi:hypothetical protein
MPGTMISRTLRWLRQSEWSLLLAIFAAVVITAVIDSNHSYYGRPLESLRRWHRPVEWFDDCPLWDGLRHDDAGPGTD